MTLGSMDFLHLGRAARRPGYFYWNVYFLIVRMTRHRVDPMINEWTLVL